MIFSMPCTNAICVSARSGLPYPLSYLVGADYNSLFPATQPKFTHGDELLWQLGNFPDRWCLASLSEVNERIIINNTYYQFPSLSEKVLIFPLFQGIAGKTDMNLVADRETEQFVSKSSNPLTLDAPFFSKKWIQMAFLVRIRFTLYDCGGSPFVLISRSEKDDLVMPSASFAQWTDTIFTGISLKTPPSKYSRISPNDNYLDREWANSRKLCPYWDDVCAQLSRLSRINQSVSSCQFWFAESFKKFGGFLRMAHFNTSIRISAIMLNWIGMLWRWLFPAICNDADISSSGQKSRLDANMIFPNRSYPFCTERASSLLRSPLQNPHAFVCSGQLHPF